MGVLTFIITVCFLAQIVAFLVDWKPNHWPPIGLLLLLLAYILLTENHRRWHQRDGIDITQTVCALKQENDRGDD